MLPLAEVWEMRPEGVNACRFVKKYPSAGANGSFRTMYWNEPVLAGMSRSLIVTIASSEHLDHDLRLLPNPSL